MNPFRQIGRCLTCAALLSTVHGEPVWDVLSDTWVAADGLGRTLPTFADVGPPRADRTVGLFYFLWLGRHGGEGPFDISKILATDPEAMGKPESPLWGPLHVPHHWGESIFGYYVSDDEAVIRKHAQMITDAGVDAVIFDVTNGFTYPESWRALLHAFAEVRSHGGRTPQIAFLCPFGDPRKVVTELWKTLYEPGVEPDQWFCWRGKPLILADPAYFDSDSVGMVKTTTPAVLENGHSLGQSFTADGPFRKVAGCFPTWQTGDAAVTLTLFENGPGGKQLARGRFENVADNRWLDLDFDPPLPSGTYYLEASSPRNRIGWWGDPADVLAGGGAFADGKPVAGDRTIRLSLAGSTNDRIRNFFTFRKPQPDYFKGPTVPGMWSWLEVSPQHVFIDPAGKPEMMSVGVAQNAVGDRLGSMSEAAAKGRSFHHGANDPAADAEPRGLNFAEQWENALKADPPFIFVTGWNEWIAGRFAEFGGVRKPVMFVDQYDLEHSRDIEPMKGGHGDSYYYQLVASIRRYKGVRPLPPVVSRPIDIDGAFDDWNGVTPEFRDSIGDPVQRDHAGWGKAGIYRNASGRNDIVAAKVSADAGRICFFVRTREPLTPSTDPDWMRLLINADGDATNGWLGYDFVVNRNGPKEGRSTIERHGGDGYHWEKPVEIGFHANGDSIELEIPLEALGLKPGPVILDFKWTDHTQETGDWSDFTLNGDAAPNDRFNYRARIE